MWGSGPSDVWAVGGCHAGASCDASAQAAILHFDGHTWSPLPSPRQAALWWVFGLSPRDVWIAGEQGTMLHFDGTALSVVPTGVEGAAGPRLFGVWGAAPDDLYVAGGLDGSSTVLHWDGARFAPVAAAPSLGNTWFKVWGSARDDVYLVGDAGAAAHFDGATWTRLDLSAAGVGPHDGLFTAAGRGKSDVYIVGGKPAQGLALHWDGVAWARVPGLALDGVPQLAGVFEGPAGEVAMTGLTGTKLVGRPVGGGAGGAAAPLSWRNDSAQAPFDDLHAVWFDAADDIFAAGGNFFAFRSGIVAHYGR